MGREHRCGRGDQLPGVGRARCASPPVSLLFAAFTWGYRLAWHVAVRARGAGEDPRYRELLDRAPGDRNWYALRVVYLPQLLILWVACLPLPAGMTQQSAPGVVTAIGCVAWLTGFAFETVGDWQLAQFRANPANRGQVMDRGLWRLPGTELLRGRLHVVGDLSHQLRVATAAADPGLAAADDVHPDQGNRPANDRTADVG